MSVPRDCCLKWASQVKARYERNLSEDGFTSISACPECNKPYLMWFTRTDGDHGRGSEYQVVTIQEFSEFRL